MNQSESIDELCGALVALQAELPSFAKNAQGYGYRYTDLDTIVSTVKPILFRHNLAFMQSVSSTQDGQLTLTTRLFSRGGQFIEDTLLLPKIDSAKVNAAQSVGMSITYMRRYSLCAMLGITSDEDLDASTQQFQTQRQVQRPAQTQRQVQRPAQTQRQVQPWGNMPVWTGGTIGKRPENV